MKTIPFWYPPKPKRIFSLSVVPQNYMIQVKKDGHRAIIIDDEKGFRILNRFGTPLTCLKDTTPEIAQQFRDIFGTGFLLDGEAVGIRQAGDITDTIILWDILYKDYKALHEHTYRQRLKFLPNFGNEIGLGMNYTGKAFGCRELPYSKSLKLYLSSTFSNIPGTIQQLWHKLKQTKYDEGLVFKNMDSNINWSLNSSPKTVDMLKLKLEDNPEIN